MRDDTTKPSAEQVKGAVKEAIGKLTGDDRVEAEGKAQRSSSKSDAKPGASRKP